MAADRRLQVVDRRIVVTVFGAALLAPLVAQAAASAADAEAAKDVLETYLPDYGMKLVEGSGAGLETRAFKGVTWAAGTFAIETIIAAGERRRLNLFSNTGAVIDVVFDAAKGIVESGIGGGIDAYMVSLGNNEFKAVVTGTATADTGNLQVRVLDGVGLPPRTGDGASGLFMLSLRGYQGVTTTVETTDFSGWTKQGLTAVPSARAFGGVQDQTDSASAALRINRPLQGRKAAWLGSSLVSSGAYIGQVATTTGLAVQNLGTPGGSIGVGAGGGGAGSEDVYDQVPNIAANADFTVVDEVTNDFAEAEVPLGVITDTTTATWYGAIYALKLAINTARPGMPVVWIQGVSSDSRVPTHSITHTNANGNRLSQYQTGLEEQCRRLGMPLIDLNQAGVGYFASQSLRTDGLHWSTEGAERVGNFVGFQLEQLARAGAL